MMVPSLKKKSKLENLLDLLRVHDISSRYVYPNPHSEPRHDRGRVPDGF